MNGNNILEKLAKFAFVSAIIGVCTIGICPAFGAIGIAVPLAMNSKKAQISEETKSLNKKTLFAGTAALFMFLIDLILFLVLNAKFGWV